MPVGDYDFQLKAKNIYGLESAIATLSFSVKPAWYASNTAVGTYLVIGLILFTLTPFVQRTRHQKETKKMVLNQRRALLSKDRAFDKFAETSNKELEVLRNEKLKTEIQHKNSELSSVTTHLIQKNEK